MLWIVEDIINKLKEVEALDKYTKNLTPDKLLTKSNLRNILLRNCRRRI